MIMHSGYNSGDQLSKALALACSATVFSYYFFSLLLAVSCGICSVKANSIHLKP